jgi:hypothetical protein
MVADVDGELASWARVGNMSLDPDGADLAGAIGGNTNRAGVRTTDTIDQTGEYFTFDLRRKATYGMGLIDVNDTDGIGKADTFCDGSGSYAQGYKWSQWLHSSHGYAWTLYGENPQFSYKQAWSGSNADKFHTNEEHATLLADGNVKFRVGIDENSFIHCDYYDVSDSRWVRFSQSGYPVAEGSEFALGLKFADNNGRLFSEPKIHEREPEAPVMYFRYIESGDGNYHYPLFATEEEAKYYHKVMTGHADGVAHTHVYPDDPTNTTWYMPDNGQMAGVNAPYNMVFDGQTVLFTEITSLTDSDLAPSPFSGPDYTFAEGDTVAIQVSPQDVGYTTSVSGLPQGLSFTGGFAIQGTTRHVYGDQTYPITVTKTNSYGSSQGTFDLTITDDVSQNAISGMTIYGQNPITQSPDTVHHYSGAVNLDVDLSLDAGTEIIWTQHNSSPVGGVGQYLQIGIADAGVDKMTTQLGNNTQDWQVKATIWTGTLNHNYAAGWTDSSSSSYSGSNDNIQWKLAFPADNGPIELYRDGVLVRTSSANFSGSQTLTVGVPVNYTTTTRMPAFTRADINYTGDPPAGFTQEHGSMDDPTTLGDGGVVSLDQVLPVGKRLLVNKSWIETNVLPYCTDPLQKAYIGVPSPSANWNSVDLHVDFDAVMRWEGQSSNAHKTTIADGSDIVARHESNIGSATNAHYHYAIEWDGTNLTVLRDTDISKFSNEHDKYQFQSYSCYENYAEQSGDLPLVMATKTGGTMTLTMSGISLVDIPAAPVSNLTPWTKALDFSGSSERAQQVSTSSSVNPLMMNGQGTTVLEPISAGDTSSDGAARPWATACVFRYDGNNSNQHIWNQGEGVGGDNIYLRMSANGYLYFGWGRDGSGINECSLGGSLSTSLWWGVYVAHNGTRLNSSNATAANLADCFDIYLMRLNDAGTEWTTRLGTLTDAEGNRSIASNWHQTGYRMDRANTGALTLGGRGANRSFHGKVASMVVTTLKRGVAMPAKAEAEMMITDPKRWEDDYRVGQTVRVSNGNSNMNYVPSSFPQGHGAVQIWLMGDGQYDNYSNMIRNQVYPQDQNFTKMNLISMVSNDIQNVNIPGLS